MKRILFGLFCLINLAAIGQSSEEEYREATRLYGLSNYEASKSAFGELIDDDRYGEYAGFYYGLSSFYLKDTVAAINMMKQLINRYPEWDQKPEVLYWLVYLNASQGDVLSAVNYNEQMEDGDPLKEKGRKYIKQRMKRLSVLELKDLLRKDSQNTEIANILAEKLSNQDGNQENEQFLDSLIAIYNLDRLSLLDIELKNEFKDEYSVALVLPFMFSSLDNPVPVIRNTLVMDLYQGIKLAQQDLETRGIKIKLHLFDTKKSAKVTGKFLEELKSMDLIIGPFYPGPVEIISQFSVDNKVNIINPLSENVDYLEASPLAFLFKPSFLTSAEKVAKWVVENVSHKNAVIYYDGNERDSLFAGAYMKILEQDSFNIMAFRQVDEPASKAILDSLIEQYEEIYPKEIADSIAEIPGRFIKERRLRKAELKDKEAGYPYFYAEDDEEKKTKLIAYEKKFVIPEDTIGSIILASRNNSIVNNIISAVTTRGDTAKLIGYKDWLDFKSLNFEQMESIGSWFVSPVYINTESDFYEDFEGRLIDNYRKIPSEYQLLGYELLRFVGENLNVYGKYFQLGLYDKGYIPGYLTQGFNYRNSNDNQAVPIVNIKDLKITPINKESYAERE